MVWASVQVPTGLGAGKGVETDRLPKDVRERAMRAVDSFGGRVTIGDVASGAGLKLDEAERALQALAADTGGFLEVVIIRHLFLFPLSFSRELTRRICQRTLAQSSVSVC